MQFDIVYELYFSLVHLTWFWNKQWNAIANATIRSENTRRNFINNLMIRYNITTYIPIHSNFWMINNILIQARKTEIVPQVHCHCWKISLWCCFGKKNVISKYFLLNIWLKKSELSKVYVWNVTKCSYISQKRDIHHIMCFCYCRIICLIHE
jgi:hypothetical protein